MTVVVPGGCTSVLQPLDVPLNKPFKGYVPTEWLAFMEKSVTELEQEDGETSDDPLSSSDEDESNDEIRQLLRRKPKPIVVKPASKQSIVDWVASAWKNIEQHPTMVAKSFLVTGIAQELDGSKDSSVRRKDLQKEIGDGLNANSETADSDSGEESEEESDSEASLDEEEESD